MVFVVGKGPKVEAMWAASGSFDCGSQGARAFAQDDRVWVVRAKNKGNSNGNGNGNGNSNSNGNGNSNNNSNSKNVFSSCEF